MIHHLCGVQSLVWFGGFFFQGRIDRAVRRVRGFGYGRCLMPPRTTFGSGGRIRTGTGTARGDGSRRRGIAIRARAFGTLEAKHGVVACDSPKLWLNGKCGVL